MAEVREVREIPVPARRGGGVLAIGMFLVGALLIAMVALVMLDVHWTIYWPAGRVDVGLKPAVTAVFHPQSATATTQADSD